MPREPETDLPEISDLVVDYDPDTLARRDVRKADVLAKLEAHGLRAAARVVAPWPERAGLLERAHVDGVLVRAHLELQRLSEEFQQGARMERLLAPLCEAAREGGVVGRVRVVDVGCGLGYVPRWLAARGALPRNGAGASQAPGDAIELVGCDYNRALIAEAGRLAALESLRCRFEAANAFRLDQPAHVFTSTGVIHHFRGADLGRFFAEQLAERPAGFIHCDIKPSWAAPIGAFIFHQARMREPLAKIDGVLSARRAHTGETLVEAARPHAAGYRLYLFDAEREALPVLKVMQAVIGVREELAAVFEAGLGPLRDRVRPAKAAPAKGGA